MTVAAKHQHICMEAYMYVDILFYITHTHTYNIYAYMYMYTHTFAVTWMNYDGHINSFETNIDADSHLPSVASKKHFRPTWAKNHMRHKSSGKKHANPPLEAWICELCFVGSHVFCWTLAHETNHNNIGETRNKPVSQFRMCFNEVTFNEWSLLSFKVNCFLRGKSWSPKSWEDFTHCWCCWVGFKNYETMSMCK